MAFQSEASQKWNIHGGSGGGDKDDECIISFTLVVSNTVQHLFMLSSLCSRWMTQTTGIVYSSRFMDQKASHGCSKDLYPTALYCTVHITVYKYIYY
jgi:hypothetical protein